MKRFKILLLLAGVSFGRVHSADTVDLETIHRIKAEAFNNSQVMDHLFYLTDVNGPRLTGSPGFQTAADWAVGRVKQWGVDNARLEDWEPFGRSWSFSRFEIRMNKPTFALIHGAPMAWCEGTRGPVRGEVVAAPFLREDNDRRGIDIETIRERLTEYKERWKGKLRGKIVLVGSSRDFSQATEAASQRMDDKSLIL